MKGKGEGIVLERDLNLFKEILIKLEKHPEKHFVGMVSIDGVDRELLEHHLELMHDAYLIKGKFVYGDNKMMWSTLKITNEGYDFLENAKNEKVWNKTIEIVKEKGGHVSFEVFKELLKQSARMLIFGQ